MTVINHALTGTVIAVAVKQPILAILLAFLPHFALDAIPHFGVHEEDVIKRNASPVFRTVVSVDTVLVITLLFVVLFTKDFGTARPVMIASGAAAILADSVWVYRFIDKIRFKWAKPFGWFARFRQKIQWQEGPWVWGSN